MTNNGAQPEGSAELEQLKPIVLHQQKMVMTFMEQVLMGSIAGTAQEARVVAAPVRKRTLQSELAQLSTMEQYGKSIEDLKDLAYSDVPLCVYKEYLSLFSERIKKELVYIKIIERLISIKCTDIQCVRISR
ncbi:hypothetical protein FQA39_LY07678 [Lamprigera yunnana]|nr:hypothetical protein FQA39_LY07678 [Lamprigera yunnana]